MLQLQHSRNLFEFHRFKMGKIHHCHLRSKKSKVSHKTQPKQNYFEDQQSKVIERASISNDELDPRRSSPDQNDQCVNPFRCAI